MLGKYVAGLLVLLLLAFSATATAQPWSTRAVLPEARQEVAVAQLAGRIYVIGGFRGDLSIADTVEVYDPPTDSWSTTQPYPTPIHHAAAASENGKLYVIGGWSNFFGTPVNTVYEYDPTADTWTLKAPMPTARAGLAVANLGGKLYAAGGSPGARERDFAVYDPVLDAWAPLPLMPTPRNHLAAGAIAGRFYAVGGRSPSIGGETDALEAFDPGTGMWSAKPAMPTARGGIAAAVFGRHLIVFGGEGNPSHPDGVFEEVEAYDTVLDEWSSLTPMPTPRHGIGAAPFEGSIHVPGGGPVEGFGVTEVHEVYAPAADLVLSLPSLAPGVAALLAMGLAALGARRVGRWGGISGSDSHRLR